MMHVAWSPPEIFDPQYKDLITHYRVLPKYQLYWL